MALQYKLMGAGMNILALASMFDVGAGLTAAGTNQGTALALKNADNEVTTVASGTGVILYAGSPGDTQTVYNAGTNVLTVYPPSGSKINSLPTNQGVLIQTNTACEFKCLTSTRWMAILSQ